MKSRNHSGNMPNYLWSDTHFNHYGILKHTDRPYNNVGEMNQALMNAWNSVVGERDNIWFLGDFAFGDPDEIFYALKGIKHLIIGNHDERNPKVMKLPWKTMGYYHKLRDNKRKIILCHYPLASWDGMHGGRIHAHGHSHGTMPKRIRRFDVGVEIFPKPISFDDLYSLGLSETFIPKEGEKMNED